jgi:Protein of unknown function (DUF3822)
MRIGERHYSFAVSDKIGDKLFSLAYYTAEEMNSDVLSEIFSTHNELHSSFFEVQVSYDHPASVLVPMPYHHGNEKALLNAMYGNTVRSAIISEAVSAWQVYNVYTVPDDVHEWVGRIFPAYKYRHNYTLNMQMMQDTAADRIMIDFDTDEFSFLVIKENKLLLAQTLSYTTPEDILYYLLKTCNQFSLSREEVELFISGLIVKESQLYRELYQYFLNTRFRESVWTLPETNEYPAHFFSSLNDLSRCAS